MKDRESYSLKGMVGNIPVYTRNLIGAGLIAAGPFLGMGNINADANITSSPQANPPEITVTYGPRPTGQVIRIGNVASDPTIEPTKDAESTNAPEITTQNELDNILGKVKANQNLSYIFNRGLTQQNLIDDLAIYYPICKAAGEKYDIPWEVIFIILERESTASRQTGNDTYVGAMQRNPSYWTNDFIQEAIKGYEHLKDLPGQRNPNDAQEIMGAAKILRELMNEHGETILGVLKYYSAEDEADFRIIMYKEFTQVLNSGQ